MTISHLGDKISGRSRDGLRPSSRNLQVLGSANAPGTLAFLKNLKRPAHTIISHMDSHKRREHDDPKDKTVLKYGDILKPGEPRTDPFAAEPVKKTEPPVVKEQPKS
jgi:hypothetical protein